MNCWHCGREIEVAERTGFHDCCPRCDRPLHVCRNCAFYDPARNRQCREPMAELVTDKERANFCEYYAPERKERAAARQPARPDARAEIGTLFRKKR